MLQRLFTSRRRALSRIASNESPICEVGDWTTLVDHASRAAARLPRRAFDKSTPQL